MNESNPVTDAGALEMLAEWEGAAVHEPGILFEEKQGEPLTAGADTAALAAWIAVTVLPGVIGNSVNEAIKQNVLGVLAGWRRRYGQAKIDEVQQQLFHHVQEHRQNAKITDEQLRKRIESLFQEIQL